MKFFRRRYVRCISAFLLVNFIAELFFPMAAYALTSGPQQPEFTSFEPVATTNMVSEFTGDFNYNLPVVNIPGPNGGGYALSLSYHSGSSGETEASWVGYGWTLNPGAINRGTKGFPDDYKQETVTYTNRIPKNWTASVGAKAGLELYSTDISLIGISASAAIRYNNYKGFGTVYGIGLAAYEGLASLNYSVSGEDGHSFSADINPAALFVARDKKRKRKAQDDFDKYIDQDLDKIDMNKVNEHYQNMQKADKKLKNSRTMSKVLAGGSQYGMHALAEDFRPSSVSKYNGTSLNISFNIAVDPTPLHIGLEGGLSGSYSEQTTEPSKDTEAYGFLYQGNTFDADDGSRMMDYAVEKESHFNKRDQFLSIPFQSPDAFTVSGEGLGGGFRLYSRNVGHYYPRRVKSETLIGNVGFDFAAGLDIQPFTGFNLGAGYHFSELANWVDVGNSELYRFSNQGDEHHFFRFNSDLGGNVTYSNNDEAYRANIENMENTPGLRKFKPQISSSEIATELAGRSGRSSYIGYHTISEMVTDYKFNSTLNRNIYLKSFTKDNPSQQDDPWDLVDKQNGGIGDRIGEIATVNEEGNRYVYGLPVFAANEVSMSYSVRDNGSGAPALTNNIVAYKDVSGGVTKTEVGETRNAPYATSYLLTQITTPDYIDRAFDGPTSDDFGGWTKFDYRKGVNKNNVPYGNASKSDKSNWFRWRMPYNGLSYDRNELCDPRDDMGGVSSGVKEIYYLKSIETKTHIAYFITNKTSLQVTHSTDGTMTLQGSLVARKDALGAADNDNADNNKSAQNTDQEQEKLEKIIIYAKDGNNQLTGKPLKTVYLDYSYELCKNIANSINYDASAYNAPAESGKLTLKKVWFEYEGIVNAKISPYEFSYAYKPESEFLSADLIAKYNNTDPAKDIIGYGNYTNQNPDYDRAGLDAWGNYGYNSPQRYDLMRAGLYQGKYPDNYDPAAWQLKGIRLPSGGEILVQYEQHEYAYVQDQMALAMISLKQQNGAGGSKDEASGDNKYYLNLNDIDIDLNNNAVLEDSELNAYVAQCSTYLAGKKAYFKFLYKLIGDGSPNINGCGSEYITGYATATVAADLPNKSVYVSFSGSGYTIPRKVCLSYVTRNKSGLNLDDNCDVARDGMSEGNPVDMVKGLVNRLGTDFKGSDLNCRSISLDNSFLRLPLLKAKKGGGIRVKRILMYDAGLEPGANGDEVLYGSEYIYKNLDGSSSGVASNEPGAIREENALISFLDKRAPQNMAQRVISGVDKEQFEGPLGESLLPPPSVGYSRVVTKNIHSGKSSTGYKVNEYYTLKEPGLAFSNAVKVTEVDAHAKDFMLIPAIWVNIALDNRWLSQGYSFILNEMHGKLKRTATYAGDYTEGNEDNSYKTFEEVYEYYQPGEKIPVLDETGNISLQYAGKEMDVTMEMKSVVDVQNDISVQVDFSTGVALFIPIFNFSLFPYFSYNEKDLRTHVISKVVRYPSIIKQVTRTQDGIVHVMENKAFSKATGQPVVTVSYDGHHKLSPEQSASHKGSYTNYTIPACLVYKKLGQMAANQGYVYNYTGNLASLGSGKYSFTLPSISLITQGLLTEGDLIKLSSGSLQSLYYISAFTGPAVELQTVSLTSPVTSFTKIEVINSGYTNMLSESAGSLATYGADYTSPAALPASPLTVSGSTVYQNNLSGLISASAETYSDVWNNSNVNADYAATSAQNLNDFETGRRGKWRSMSSYVYKADVKDAVTGTNRIYTGAGVVSSPFTGFSYSSEASNDDSKWIRTNTVTAYSPNGNALEEQNTLGIKTTAKFSHNESMPALIARNAPYTSVFFRSFEDVPGASSEYAHSGSSSGKLTPNAVLSSGQVVMDDQIRNRGLSYKLWIRSDQEVNPDYLEVTLSDGSSGIFRGVPAVLGRVGEWTLAEYLFKDIYANVANGTTLSLGMNNKAASTLWVDDLRMQPLDAQMTCYVYDKNNLRLLSSFDDQHFGLFYQYNAEGRLVRKLVETERGLKTITESQYNTPVR